MKRIGICLLLVSFITLSVVQPLFAADQADKVLFQKDEITDIDTLYTMAVQGITDKDTSPQEDAIVVDQDGNVQHVKSYNTTQLLKSEIKNGKLKNTYATTSVAYFSKPGTSEDGTGSVTASSTIYWTENESNNLIYHDLTAVSGSWEINDYADVSIIDRKAQFMQKGWVYGGGYADDQSTTRYYSADSFYDNPPSSWEPVYDSGSNYFVVGVNQIVTIIGNGDIRWTFSFKNFV